MALVFQTKSQVAYDMLKESIISGKLRPDDKITLSDVAASLGISEIPVREALARLESEQFVVSAPHVGYKVTKLTKQELREIFEVRVALERLAAENALPAYADRPARVEALVGLLQEMYRALDASQFAEFWHLNTRFHETLYEPCGNGVLITMIGQLWERSGRSRAIFAVNPGRARESLREHQALIDAVRSGDRETLGRRVEEHVRNALAAVLSSPLVEGDAK